MQTKTRAIRLSDAVWDELERRASEYKLRGRAEYIEYNIDNPTVTTQIVERIVEVPDPATERALDAANARIATLEAQIQVAQTPRVQPASITDFPSWQAVYSSWTDKERKEWMDNKWKGFAENWCKKTLSTAKELVSTERSTTT